MQYFMAIPAPDKISEIVRSARTSLGLTQLVAEPHITVKAQGGLAENTLWMNKIKAVVESTSPIRVKTRGVSSFGDKVAFIDIESPELLKLHERLVEAVNPDTSTRTKYFERTGEFHLHITFATEKIPEATQLIEKELMDMEPFIFTATYVRIFRQEKEGLLYQKFLDITFGSSES